MMIHSYIRLRNWSRLLFPLVVGWLVLMATFSRAQMSLNVTNYGARGDAVQLWVNTTINSVVLTTTNRLSSADIGKTIEVFGAGAVTTSPKCQDMVATITNVVNGTNIYVSQKTQATLMNAFATYGHDNHTNFQNCITAATGTNTTINIPAGKYLLLCPPQLVTPLYPANAAIVLRGGGLRFVGAGTNSTTLLSQGAWQNQSGACTRGVLFAVGVPITNDYPVSFQNMTLDGGVQQGNTSNQNYPASTVDGQGWDGTHHAIAHIGGAGANFTSETWSNLLFTHWRGEMVISTDNSTNGNLSILNCAFVDGNATALNVYQSQNISNCLFETLFQTFEFYQAFYTNTSFFQNNFITNLTGNGCAFNGGITNRVIPKYYVTGNTWYLPAANGVETTPGQNIHITGNNFFGGVSAIALGVAGYQGTAVNSNIVVAYNTFSNCFYGIQVEGVGNNEVANVLVSSNLFYGSGGGCGFATGYGWSTNVSVKANTISGSVQFALNGSPLLGQWFLDDLSNQFPPYQQWDNTGQSNTITYATGMRQQISANVTNSVWFIDDMHPQQVPPGAVLQITSAGNYPAPLYSSTSMLRTPIVLATGQTDTFVWTNGVWGLFSSQVPSSVAGFHVVGPGP